MISTAALFPLLALLVSALAWVWPELLNGYGGAIVPLLSLVMFLMGLTLSAADFKRVLTTPQAVAIGVALQFLLMPATAWLVVQLVDLPE